MIGIIYSFQEQTTEDQVMLDGFGTVVNVLGEFNKHNIDNLLLPLFYRYSREALSSLRSSPQFSGNSITRVQGVTASGGPYYSVGDHH